MTGDERKQQSIYTFSAAVKYLIRDGWPTLKHDEAAANATYAAWLRDTQAAWEQSSGYRDRDALHAALQTQFVQQYGEYGGLVRLIVFAQLLEARSRRLGHSRTTAQPRTPSASTTSCNRKRFRIHGDRRGRRSHPPVHE